MKIGSFFPNKAVPTTFAVSADDCTLHFDRAQLNAKQLEDDKANKDLIAILQVGTTFLGKPQDNTYLYDEFQQHKWAEILAEYAEMFADLGLSPIPLSHVHYAPREDFYAPIAALAIDTRPTLLSIYLTSGSNEVLRKDTQALATSRTVNSKMALARDAQSYALPVPDTLIVRHDELMLPHVARFVEAHGGCVMLKVMGLAGARNVIEIESVAQALDYVADYPQDLEVLLQEKLDDSQFTEMTVDLIISTQQISIANIRKILIVDGLWVGNWLSPDLTLTQAQQDVLIRVGEYVREKGYSADEGLNCGLDFFINNDTGEVVLIEINARYTGGLMPAQMLAKLPASANRLIDPRYASSIVCFAAVEQSRLRDYIEFIKAHLHGNSEGMFAAISMGFSPYVQHIDGSDLVYVWQLVIGDLTAFNQAKDAALGAHNIAVTNQIDAHLRENNW